MAYEKDKRAFKAPKQVSEVARIYIEDTGNPMDMNRQIRQYENLGYTIEKEDKRSVTLATSREKADALVKQAEGEARSRLRNQADSDRQLFGHALRNSSVKLEKETITNEPLNDLED
jgi:hypothetical protein